MGRYQLGNKPPPAAFRAEYGCLNTSSTNRTGLCVSMGQKLKIDQPVEEQQCEDHIIERPLGSKGVVFGLFDGHGGHVCSRTAGATLVENVARLAKTDAISQDALVSTFRKVDREWCAGDDTDSGTTAVIGALQGARLTIAHVGDSRAILVRKDKSYVVLTSSHTPKNDQERELVIGRGGHIADCTKGESPRVNGLIEVTRSLGDKSLKHVLDSTPDVLEHIISEDDAYLVVGSDGLFCDGFADDLVANMVIRLAFTEGKSNDELAMSLAKRAYSHGSMDDISVFVLSLKGGPFETTDAADESSMSELSLVSPPSDAPAPETPPAACPSNNAAFTAPSVAALEASTATDAPQTAGQDDASCAPAPRWKDLAMRGLQWGSCALAVSAVVVCVLRSRRR